MPKETPQQLKVGLPREMVEEVRKIEELNAERSLEIMGPKVEIHEMDTAPKGRPVFLTSDLETFVAAVWRKTRRVNLEKRCWEPIAYWAILNTKERVPFEPLGWARYE